MSPVPSRITGSATPSNVAEGWSVNNHSPTVTAAEKTRGRPKPRAFDHHGSYVVASCQTPRVQPVVSQAMACSVRRGPSTMLLPTAALKCLTDDICDQNTVPFRNGLELVCPINSYGKVAPLLSQ